MSKIENHREIGSSLCETQEIKGLLFKLTCGACPEQYDVFKDNEQVAYVRLRHGWLYVSDPSMDSIWWQIDDTDDVTPQLKGDGVFDSSEERYYFLNKIADVIIEKKKGGVRMKGIYNEGDLGNAYSDWLKYKSLVGGREHIRFGQYVYNEYDLEYKNSYNNCSDLDAYNLLSEYLYQKESDNATK